jgi:hypothetical protein
VNEVKLPSFCEWILDMACCYRCPFKSSFRWLHSPLIVAITLSSLIGCSTSTQVSPSVHVAPTSGSSSSSIGSVGSTGSTSATGTTTSPGSSSSDIFFASVSNFGDSITCGYYATPADGDTGFMYSMEGYATLLDTMLAVPPTYLCRGGDWAADMTRLWVYPNTNPSLGANQLYTALIGTNDAYACGPSNGCVTNWRLALQASLAWLALPATDKVTGAAMIAQTNGGASAWQTDLEFGAASTHSGATLSFDVPQTVAGRSLYVAYRVFDSGVLNGGVAVVNVDGVRETTLSAVVNTGHAISTQNGTADTIFLASVPLGVAGTHNITITTTSAEGSFFSVIWAGASKANYATVTGAPTVIVGPITLTSNDTLNQIVTVYNAQLTTLIDGFVANGMNILIAPTGTTLQPSDLVDVVHPGNEGHTKLASAFISVIQK